MVWLTSLPAWALVVFCVGLSVLAAIASRVILRAFIPATQAEMAYSIAAPIMTALAAGFAVLMALTVANAAAYLSSAQSIVNSEAADASRLAWASTTPGVDSATVQQALLGYLEATRAHEWHGATAGSGADPATVKAIAHLENVVRAQAGKKILGTPESTELLASLDAVTSDRRARLAVGSHELPGLYAVTLAVTGLALIVNASVIALRGHRRAAHPDRWAPDHRRSEPGVTFCHWLAISWRHNGERAADRLRYPKPTDRLFSPLVGSQVPRLIKAAVRLDGLAHRSGNVRQGQEVPREAPPPLHLAHVPRRDRRLIGDAPLKRRGVNEQ